MSTMHPTDINAALVNLARKRSQERWQTVPVGLTPLLRPMLALIDTRSMPFATDEHRPSILLVAGLRGESMDTPRILTALDLFARSSAAGASGVALSALAASNPDALAGGDWEPATGNQTDLTQGFPLTVGSTPTRPGPRADTCGGGFAIRRRTWLSKWPCPTTPPCNRYGRLMQPPPVPRLP